MLLMPTNTRPIMARRDSFERWRPHEKRVVKRIWLAIGRISAENRSAFVLHAAMCPGLKARNQLVEAKEKTGRGIEIPLPEAL
jgi:hypothetical protein